MVHNFNAGPSILPREVLQQASEALLNFNNTGLSILEIGHRTPLFEEILNEAISLIKELMQLDSDHEVLFLHGGASTQFMQVPIIYWRKGKLQLTSITVFGEARQLKKQSYLEM